MIRFSAYYPRQENGFFDLDYYVNGQAKSGFYVLLVSDATTGALLMYACCEVS